MNCLQFVHLNFVQFGNTPTQNGLNGKGYSLAATSTEKVVLNSKDHVRFLLTKNYNYTATMLQLIMSLIRNE